MLREIQQGLPAPFALYALMIAAAILAATRRPRRGAPVDKLVQWFCIGLAVQALHVVEEFVTGFQTRFPELTGLPAMTDRFFVGFNLLWIAVWVLSAVGITHGYRIAWFPVWFFALGMLLNGLAHPALAAWSGGYFPGLVTAPVAGVAGWLVLRQLVATTAGSRPTP